ncbi:MAG: Maf family protein [Gammaproteobacteria bacterium]|nr:Maf family protein [Gammaproteobacteria bacterium]
MKTNHDQIKSCQQLITQLLSEKTIILASQSKGRAQLLQQMGISFSIEISNVDEEFYKQRIPDKPQELAHILAIEKAKAVALHKQQGLIIAADTLIQVQDKGQSRMVGKADNEDHAQEILTVLSGKTHQVISGVAVIDVENNKMETGIASTAVSFRNLSYQTIQDYLALNEWQGKAGAYGIQDDSAKKLITHIEGDKTNVVGLPLSLLHELMKKLFYECEL